MYRIASNCGPGDQDQFLRRSHNWKYQNVYINILEENRANPTRKQQVTL